MSECTACGGTGWTKGDYSSRDDYCPACKGSGTDVPALMYYDDLLPPENPDYPWKGKGWQPLCYYCCQPTQIDPPEAMHRQRVGISWKHVKPAVSGNKYINGSTWHCDPAKVEENIQRHAKLGKQFERPRCHICGTQTVHHRGHCSAVGQPPMHVTTMSRKEDELTHMFGWGPFKKTATTLETKTSETKITTPVVIGVLVLLGLVALVVKMTKDETDGFQLK
jgi:hypothetical protein